MKKPHREPKQSREKFTFHERLQLVRTFKQSSQFCTVLAKILAIFHFGTPLGAKNLTEIDLLIFWGVSGCFGSCRIMNNFSFFFFFFNRKNLSFMCVLSDF